MFGSVAENDGDDQGNVRRLLLSLGTDFLFHEVRSAMAVVKRVQIHCYSVRDRNNIVRTRWTTSHSRTDFVKWNICSYLLNLLLWNRVGNFLSIKTNKRKQSDK